MLTALCRTAFNLCHLNLGYIWWNICRASCTPYVPRMLNGALSRLGLQNRGCLMTLSKVFWKSVLILGTQARWNMRCHEGLTGNHVQESVRDAKAGDRTVPYPDLGPAAEIHTSLMSVWREGLINTVTLGLLNGEQIVATLTNKISSMLLESCQWLQMEQ